MVSELARLNACHTHTITTTCMPGMQACQAYQSCCVCTHSWSAGPGRKLNYDGYRRFLVPGSRGRQMRVRYADRVYEYRNVETRIKPRYRDTEFVRSACCYAKQTREQFLGHKVLPLLSRWPGYDWYRYNCPDLMHGK